MKTEKTYQLLFKNQSVDSINKYRVVRETKMYLFLEPITKLPIHIFRVHKNTLNVKGFKYGENGYSFEVPSAVSLKLLN